MNKLESATMKELYEMRDALEPFKYQFQVCYHEYYAIMDEIKRRLTVRYVSRNKMIIEHKPIN